MIRVILSVIFTTSDLLLDCLVDLLVCFSASLWGGNSGENCSWWHQETGLSSVSASKHYKSGSHIRYSLSKLVLCGTSWVITGCGFSGCTAGEWTTIKLQYKFLYAKVMIRTVLVFSPLEQIATLIAVYANWSFAAIEGIGWGWAGVIWLYNIIFYIPLDLIKFFIRYALSGRAWDLVIEQRVSLSPWWVT